MLKVDCISSEAMKDGAWMIENSKLRQANSKTNEFDFHNLVDFCENLDDMEN